MADRNRNEVSFNGNAFLRPSSLGARIGCVMRWEPARGPAGEDPQASRQHGPFKIQSPNRER
jgi:hypothetical protein